MIELSRRVEPQDVIAALAGVALPIGMICDRGKLNPPELYRIIQVMEGLLALRSVIAVQQSHADVRLENLSADLLELATGTIQRARELLVASAVSVAVDDLLNRYADTIDVALMFVMERNRELEPRFRLALRWTTS